MDFKFRMPELLAVLSYFIYSQNAILSYTLITLAILSSLARFLIDFSKKIADGTLTKQDLINARKNEVLKKYQIKREGDQGVEAASQSDLPLPLHRWRTTA